jgi:membrane protein YqaA with SNARE-associated domain
VIDWLAFIALSVVSNTPIPLAFDPIMLEFARTHASEQAWTAAIVGAIGAGVGGTLEMLAFRVLGRRYPNVGRGLFRAPSGPWFYPWTALMALLPIPFTVVRVAAYLTRARPSLYGLAVMAGRLPRHAAIVALSSRLTLPSWVGPLMVLLAVSPLLLRWLIGTAGRVAGVLDGTSADGVQQAVAAARSAAER